MKRRKKKCEAKEVFKYGFCITALCLCWMTFKHTNTIELVVGVVSLAYLLGVAIWDSVTAFLKEED